MKNIYDGLEQSVAESAERLIQVTPTMCSIQGEKTTGMTLLLSRSVENIISITTKLRQKLLNWLGISI